ncbi:MAG: tetratricopeptide repeat protein [Muribaculaceae bacterium]|nr:tetratricopeptide repeat protein [Muribaculaceae bacterium]
MKFKFLVSLILLGGSLSALAQGYKDGIEYYKVGQYDNAKELLLRNLNDASTNKSEAYYYLGCLDMKENKVADAKANFEKGQAADANNPYNLIGLGAVALKNGNAKEAEELFKSAQKLVKKNPKVEAAIARAYSETDPVAYAKQIEKATKNAKKYEDGTDPDIYILEGDMNAAEKKWGDAAGLYEMAFNFDPENIEAYVKYANTYYNVNPEMAINKLTEILAKKPNSALVQRELAEKYYKNEQWAKAAVQYGKYIENPNHFTQDRSRYAFLLFYGQKYDESLALSKELVATLPATDPQHFYMKRMAFYNLVALKNWNEAEVAAQDLFNSQLPAGVKYEAKDYTDYATVLKELGKTQEALAKYEKAVELNPDKVELLKEISDAYLDAEDYIKSADFFQKFVNSGKFVTNDLLVLSQRYSNVAATDTTGLHKDAAIQKALHYADTINSLVPNHPRILFQIARCKMLMDKENTDGNAVEAMNNLVACLDQDPANKTGRANDYIFAYRYNAVYFASMAGKIKKEDKKYKDNPEYNEFLAKMKESYEKWLEVDPANEGLRKYVESLNAADKK